MMQLQGKTAFVTGAAQGLGAAIAHAMHAEGARVILTDINAEVEETARVLQNRGDGAVFSRQLDVSDVDAFEEVFTSVSKEVGGIDILVNNAGVTPVRSIWEIEPREWDEVLGINLRSVFFACQIAGQYLRDRGWGRIINLSSMSGQQPGRLAGAHYSASKAAIISVTKNFATALADAGVTVNAIAPAAIHTPVMDGLPAERVDLIRQSIPVQRIGKSEEVAATAVYLASDSAAFVTGATIDINGGLFMR